MAGGPSTYIIGGRKVPSRQLAMACIAGYALIGVGMSMRGGNKQVPSVESQMSKLEDEESKFVKEFMAQLEAEEKTAHKH